MWDCYQFMYVGCMNVGLLSVYVCGMHECGIAINLCICTSVAILNWYTSHVHQS